MNANYCLGPLCYQTLHVHSVDVQRVRLYVRKHRDRSLIQKRDICRRTSKYRRDYLVTVSYASKNVREVQSVGSRSHGDRLTTGGKLLREPLLKLIDLGTLPNPARLKRRR